MLHEECEVRNGHSPGRREAVKRVIKVAIDDQQGGVSPATVCISKDRCAWNIWSIFSTAHICCPRSRVLVEIRVRWLWRASDHETQTLAHETVSTVAAAACDVVLAGDELHPSEAATVVSWPKRKLSRFAAVKPPRNVPHRTLFYHIRKLQLVQSASFDVLSFT
jgi:hypothetical protein